MAAPSASAASPAAAQVRLRSQPPAIPPHLQSTATLQGLVASVEIPRRSSKARITNWGGTFTSKPPRVFQPTTVAECCNILELARRTGNTVRAVGKAHSPSDLMMSDMWAIRTEDLAGVREIDADAPSATFLAGTLISDINDALASNTPPLALRSLGSISEQTIGGAIATSTHGSGYHFPSVSSMCLELGIIIPLPPDQGGIQVITCNRKQNVELFNASLCSLGCTGLIFSITMKVEPAFRLRHLVEEIEFDWMFGRKTGYPAVEAAVDQEVSGAKVQHPSPRGAVGEATMSSLGFSSAESDEKRVYGAPRKALQSIGMLVAQGKPLPPMKARYYPSTCQADPAEIYPCRVPHTEETARVGPDSWTDDEDDEETRAAQARIEGVIQSAQHTRLWWFPHVKMITLSRADRTLEPAVGPTLSQRAYHSILGYHFTQFLLFVSRYHSSLPPRVAKMVHYLTHPAFPVEHRGKLPTNKGTSGESTSSPVREPLPVSLVKDFESFQSAPSVDLAPSGTGGSLKPLEAHNPHSFTIDDSVNVFNMDCLFKQYTSEWTIPYTHTAACLRAMRDWLEEEAQQANGERIHFPVEVRWTDADGIWLSHGYGRRNCYIGIIQFRPYHFPVRYRLLFSRFEKLIRHFSGRPHWAKSHTCGPEELRRLYPHLDDFLTVRNRYDPQGVLLNAYIRRHLLGEIGEEVGVRRFKKRNSGKL